MDDALVFNLPDAKRKVIASFNSAGNRQLEIMKHREPSVRLQISMFIAGVDASMVRLRDAYHWPSQKVGTFG